MRTAIVQIPAFSESPWTDRLDQITAQSPPDGWTVDFEAWVTPNCPNLDGCMTYQNAKNHPDVEAHVAPEGKLPSRNEAHTHAAEDRDADVIVSWDADAPPLNDYVLAALLMPYDDDQVVATNGNPVAPGTVVGRLTNFIGGIDDRLRPQMHGQLSSFTVDAWGEVGPFETDTINQRDIAQVRSIEEFEFRNRIERYGTVVDVPEAKVLNDTRRNEAKASRAFSRFTPKYPDEFHGDRQATFHPKDGE